MEMEKVIIQHGRPLEKEKIAIGMTIGKCWIKCRECGCIWETDTYMHYARGMVLEHCPECGKICSGLCQNPQHANIIPR